MDPVGLRAVGVDDRRAAEHRAIGDAREQEEAALSRRTAPVGHEAVDAHDRVARARPRERHADGTITRTLHRLRLLDDAIAPSDRCGRDLDRLPARQTAPVGQFSAHHELQRTSRPVDARREVRDQRGHRLRAAAVVDDKRRPGARRHLAPELDHARTRRSVEFERTRRILDPERRLRRELLGHAGNQRLAPLKRNRLPADQKPAAPATRIDAQRNQPQRSAGMHELESHDARAFGRRRERTDEHHGLRPRGRRLGRRKRDDALLDIGRRREQPLDRHARRIVRAHNGGAKRSRADRPEDVIQPNRHAANLAHARALPTGDDALPHRSGNQSRLFATRTPKKSFAYFGSRLPRYALRQVLARKYQHPPRATRPPPPSPT